MVAAASCRIRRLPHCWSRALALRGTAQTQQRSGSLRECAGVAVRHSTASSCCPCSHAYRCVSIRSGLSLRIVLRACVDASSAAALRACVRCALRVSLTLRIPTPAPESHRRPLAEAVERVRGGGRRPRRTKAWRDWFECGLSKAAIQRTQQKNTQHHEATLRRSTRQSPAHARWNVQLHRKHSKQRRFEKASRWRMRCSD